MSRLVRQKLKERRIWERVWHERLTEPVHLNMASLVVAAFGGFRAKVDYDLVVRPQHAYGLLNIADKARERGVRKLTCVEFGVANGAGLLNLGEIARHVTEETGVEFSILGFDTGTGMPPPRDYRDHPEHYRRGDYPLQDRERLLASLPDNTRIIFGDIAETVPGFLVAASDPIGFVSVDVDYYWSTREALRILDGPVELYLPWVVFYFDDIQYDTHSRFAGQLLAIEDFNRGHELRKLDRLNFLAETRLFRRARWIHQMYLAHIFDHPERAESAKRTGTAVLSNPYT